MRFFLFDRTKDPGETRDVAAAQVDALRSARREVEVLIERVDQEWVKTRLLLAGQSGEPKLTRDACDRLIGLGYVVAGCS